MTSIELNLLSKKGKLIQKPVTTRLNWPDLAFYAIAAGEQLEDFTVVTLASQYKNLAHEQAVDLAPFKGDEDEWLNNIHLVATKIMDKGTISVREMVKVDKDYNVFVVLDDSEITDGSMERAMAMLEESKMPGTTYFGDPVSYTAEQIAYHEQQHGAPLL